MNDSQDQFQTQSPTPASAPVQSLSFPDAVREIIAGHRVTRLSWNNVDEFGCIQNTYLSVHTKGEYHEWLINDGDLNAIDWVVIPDVQAN